MDRLTFEGNFCDIAMCRENPCPYNGKCSRHEVWERLKAYENTNLEPDEIEQLREENRDLRQNCYTADEIRSYMAAIKTAWEEEKDG